MNKLEDQTHRTSEFVRLFAESSQRIRWFIRAAVPTPDAADEVFQETSAALWEKFAEFKSGTEFGAWALRVAHFRILKYRNGQARDLRVFSQEVVEQLLVDAGQAGEALDRRRRWLADCFSQLPFADREIVNRRYAPGATSKRVSEELGRSQSFISKSLARIHQLLYECISRHEAEEGAPS